MRVSYAVMAHEERRDQAVALGAELGCDVIWDRFGDRWDTGQRALLAYEPDADWHVVVQDDAVLCRKFKAGVEMALAAAPEVPVSFYTGKTRPRAFEIQRAVIEAKELGKHWLAMDGPLWGVALAFPVTTIEPMVKAVGDLPVPNYDLRIAEYFNGIGSPCWYSIPSLVDHLTGPDNPSLVIEPDGSPRGSSIHRSAHEFIGKRKDPTKVNWESGALPVVPPHERWVRVAWGTYACGSCGQERENLLGMLIHHGEAHNLETIDFLSLDVDDVELLEPLYKGLPDEMRGTFWIGGSRELARHASVTSRLVRTNAVKRVLSKSPKRFTIVGQEKAFKMVGSRPSWSMEGSGI